MNESYGPLVRLWGIRPSKLPGAEAQPEELKVLLSSIILEALPFLNSVPSEIPSMEPATELQSTSDLWKHKTVKTYDGSAASVHVFERTVDAETLGVVAQKNPGLGIPPDKAQSELWALRRSTHEAKKEKGTADWDEFLRCFKEKHGEAEKTFTPSVVNFKRLQEWDCSGIEIQLNGETWIDWTLRHEESVHDLPGPLSKRVFPVLQATAAVRGRKEFLVVQIAIRAGDDATDVAKHGGPIRAAYTSVERVRELGDRSLEWVMGTASDAKGLVPMWAQKLGLSGAIAKDVGMFMDWIGRERLKGKDAEVIGDLE
ncbi:START-like domain containing protein [Fusarium agapanthi]|uniref:START-like domain containing protein n=1 Tax=Fusarium agapanthi TaxID=1803897 RepID=A0A9P5E411_9HYPO|nr:START-like domain containing protein [Fusarium agapanthi]